MGKEIITLAFGPYASYTNTHFWNIQEEMFNLRNDENWQSLISYLDLSTLYHIAQNEYSREIRHPRTVILDSSNKLHKWNLHDLNESFDKNNNYSKFEMSNNFLWDEHVDVFDNAYKKHLFQEFSLDKTIGKVSHNSTSSLMQKLNQEQSAKKLACSPDVASVLAADHLDYTARHFTDFAEFKLKEQSIIYPHSDFVSSISSAYDKGLEMAARTDFLDEWENRIRFFTEECDAMQGFLSLTDVLSGLAGAAANLIECLRDLYPKVPILSLGLRRPRENTTISKRSLSSISQTHRSSFTRFQHDNNYSLNEALLIADVSEHVTLHVPMECPRLRHLKDLSWDPNNNYQTSAVLSCLLDTLTIPTRVALGYSGNTTIGPPIGCETDLGSFFDIALNHGKPGQLGFITAAMEIPQFKLKYDKGSYQTDFDDDSFVCFSGMNFEGGNNGNIAESIISRGARVTTSNGISQSHEYSHDTRMFQNPISEAQMCSNLGRLMIVPTPLPLPITFPKKMLKVKTAHISKKGLSNILRLVCPSPSIYEV